MKMMRWTSWIPLYVPSKYPVYSELPRAMPGPEICKEDLKAAEKVQVSVCGILNVEERR